MLIIIGALGTVSKGMVRRMEESIIYGRVQDHPN